MKCGDARYLVKIRQKLKRDSSAKKHLCFSFLIQVIQATKFLKKINYRKLYFKNLTIHS